MKKLEWHKITPLSKAVALALFVALPFIGFYYGIRYGETAAYVNGGPRDGMTPPEGYADAYYRNTAAWQNDVRNETGAGFSIAYPLDFETNDFYSQNPSMDWRLGGGGVPGYLFFTLAIPRAFEPQTNFVGAKLTVGVSRNQQAVADCLDEPSGGPETTSTAVVNGATFGVMQYADAGAGNYYQTKSYRALRGGTCWTIEYTIHSSQIANYPAEYGLKPFNEKKLTDVLDRVVSTFKFL